MVRTALAARSFVLRSASALAWLPQTAARIGVGWVFVQSGWGKLHDLPQVVDYFSSLGIPLPQLQAPFVAGVELVGGVLILAGLLTRVASVPIAATMVVALLTARRADVTNLATLAGTVEFLYLLLLGFLAAFGAGILSLDALLARRFATGVEAGAERLG